MNKDLTTLPNGLRVLSINNPSAESVTITVLGKAGSMYENLDQIGAAHFLEHVVLDASEDYPDETKLTSLIEDVGGTRQAMTSKEFVEYTVKVLPQHIEQAFIFLSQIVLHPLLQEKDIQKHKGIIEQEIERFKADPEKYVPSR